MTLNGVYSGCYFALFQRNRSIRGALRKSGRRYSQTFCNRNVVQKLLVFSDISLTMIWCRELLHRGGIKRKRVAKYSDFGRIDAISRKRCKIGSKLVLITNRKSYMNFWLVPKSVTLNDLERYIGPYFALFHRIFVHDVVAKQLLGLPRFHNLLLIVCDHIKTICAIIQRLFGQNKLITRFDSCRCIDDSLCA